jgi:hypothetical protein
MNHISSMPIKFFFRAISGMFACIAVAWAVTPPAGPHSMTYREFDRGIEKIACFSIVRDQTGYSVSILSTQGKEQTREELFCDSTWRTLRWHYRSDNNTDIDFKRCGESIVLTGILRGKPVSKNLGIDKHPWYQLVTLGMAAVSADSAAGVKFWAVSIDGPAILKAVPFRVAAITDTSLPGHPEIRCRCVQVKLDGILGRFWNGYYYIRSDNSRFVHYEGYRLGSKKPAGTIDVVQ